MVAMVVAHVRVEQANGFGTGEVADLSSMMILRGPQAASIPNIEGQVRARASLPSLNGEYRPWLVYARYRDSDH